MPAPKSIYQIKVTLNDSKPPIWRRVLVPDTTTLSQLHDILQIVMGWMNSHLHHFIIGGQFYGEFSDDEFGITETKDEARFNSVSCSMSGGITKTGGSRSPFQV